MCGHRIGSGHPGAEEYPSEKTQANQRWCTHMSRLTQFMPPTETYKSEIGSQPTMCHVHNVAYVSLLPPGKTERTACRPGNTAKNILNVVPITTHTHIRLNQVNWKKKQRKEKKMKRRKYKKIIRERKNKRKQIKSKK